MAVKAYNTRPDVMLVEKDVHINTTPPFYATAFRRVSWQAILSGVAVALIMQFTLNLLGLSIGAASFDPLYEQDPLQIELATGTVIWMAASALISLFFGGIVAGRMAGMTDPVDGALQGVVTWAVVSVLTIVLLTSIGGNLIGTASSLLSGGLNLAGESLSAIAPEAAEAVDLQDIRLQGIMEEARELLTPATTTETSTTETTNEQSSVAVEDNNTTQNMTASEREVNLLITRLLRDPEVNAADREAVVSFLTAQGNMNEQEAQQMVDGWVQTYQETTAQAEQTLREVGQAVADSLALIAGVLFMVLIVGAFAAGAGGIVGSPHTSPFVDHEDKPEMAEAVS